MSPELTSDLHAARSWLTQALGQLYRERQHSLDLANALNTLNEINKLDARLRSEGVTPPKVRDPQNDPMGNMMDWRDYLVQLLPLS